MQRLGLETMTPLRTTSIPVPDAILNLGQAYAASKTLLSAIELGVFTELARGALDAKTLTVRLGLDARGTPDFLDTLVALHMLKRRRGRYANTAETDLFLDRRKLSYLGDALQLTNARRYPLWGHLTQALRTGNPQSEPACGADDVAALEDDPVRLASSFQAMTSGTLVAARVMARAFPWDDYRSFADISPAHGALSVEVATAHPHMTGVCFDRPQLRLVFEAYVRDHKLQQRVRFCGGDPSRDSLPRADVLLVSRGLHHWSLDARRGLLTRAYQALTDEGALIVCESLIDDNRRRNIPGLLLSLSMLLETANGAEFTGAECASWMAAAGFRDAHVEPLFGGESMVVGIK
jgi:hypothetical protein